MSDTIPHPASNSTVPPANPLPALDPVAVMAALGSPFRWPIIQLLADGRELSITDGADIAGCTAVNFSKHLGVLAAAGVVECYAGEDRRKTMFRIPAACRQVPGVIDYGICKLTVKPG
jgi:predicted transcriptional regulator